MSEALELAPDPCHSPDHKPTHTFPEPFFHRRSCLRYLHLLHKKASTAFRRKNLLRRSGCLRCSADVLCTVFHYVVRISFQFSSTILSPKENWTYIVPRPEVRALGNRSRFSGVVPHSAPPLPGTRKKVPRSSTWKVRDSFLLLRGP